MRIFRTTIAAFCAALTLLLTSSCDHKDLCFHHPHTQTIHLVFDWHDAPEAHPEGMIVFFYPILDTENRAEGEETPDPPTKAYSFNLSPEGGNIDGVRPGKYRIITYNNDTDGVLFQNDNDFDGHAGYTREGSLLEPIYGNAANRAPKAPGVDQRIVICPDEMWGCSVAEIEITETGVKYIHYPFDPGADVDITKPVANNEYVITLYPHLLTCYYDYEIKNATNLENMYQMCASLSGMSPSLLFANEILDEEPVSHPFAANSDQKNKRITGKFITWGHHESNAVPHYLMLYVWMYGESKGFAFPMDVTEQVDKAPDKRHVHLVIDHLELPVIINPGDSGFAPSVDDWVVENMDLVM